MGVKEQMIEVLRSSETSRIRFNYRTAEARATINGDSFRRIASGLQSGHFHVVEGRHEDNMITYSAWADPSNDTEANTFYLGNNQRWSRDFNALVVHESVHAFFDLTRTTIPWADNEAAAYIAQGYYLRNSGFPESRMDGGAHYRLGYLIAQFAARGEDFSSMIGGLRQNLLNDPDYSHYITTTFSGNG
jgi:hypothetical protein